MVKPNVIVDSIRELSSPSEAMLAAAPLVHPSSQFVAVSFQGGQTAFLNKSLPQYKVWSEVISSLRDSKGPVYVEIDPQTNVITELLIPVRVRVGDIVVSRDKKKKDIEVELVISHGLHYLRRTNPYFQELAKALQTAKKKGSEVLVTERLDDHEIIDVRMLSGTLGSETISRSSTTSPPENS